MQAIYMKIYMYYIIYRHEDIHVLCNIYTKIQCIMKYVYMEIYVYYVVWLHAEKHVSCHTFT